jgi:hypothetical protein
LRRIRGPNLGEVKTVLEIAAYFCGVSFLLLKLWGGQANAGMGVSLELTRAEAAATPGVDHLVVLLKLSRPDLGRVQLDDVALEISDGMNPDSSPRVLRAPRLTAERQILNGRVTEASAQHGTALPPGDATQISYITQVKRGVPVLVDVTVLASRSGPWFGKPQWRASAIALPVALSTPVGNGKGGSD